MNTEDNQTSKNIDDNIDSMKLIAHKSLKERIAESEKPLVFSNEINWGSPEGKEIW